MKLILTIITFSCLLTACGGSGGGGGSSGSPSGTTYSVLATWSANRDKAVNATGGGYKIYHSTTSGFNVSTASFVDVPYVSGSAAPTSATVTALAAGTHYFKVVAYSALIPPGSSSGATSSPSAEFSLTLP